MKNIKTIFVLIALIAVTTSYALPSKAPKTNFIILIPDSAAITEITSTSIPIIKKYDGSCYFTNAQLLTAFNVGGATLSPSYVFTSVTFSGGWMIGKGYRSDTPSYSIKTGVPLTDNGTDWVLPQAYPVQSFTCQKQLYCCDECNMKTAEETCECNQRLMTDADGTWTGCAFASDSFICKKKDYGALSGWHTTIFNRLQSY